MADTGSGCARQAWRQVPIDEPSTDSGRSLRCRKSPKTSRSSRARINHRARRMPQQLAEQVCRPAFSADLAGRFTAQVNGQRPSRHGALPRASARSIFIGAAEVGGVVEADQVGDTGQRQAGVLQVAGSVFGANLVSSSWYERCSLSRRRR